MACIKFPSIPLPTLPTGFGFGVTLPPIVFNANLCCKVLPFPIATPPIPLSVGVQIPPAILAAVSQATQVLLAYVDQLQINCPLE